MQTKYFTLGQDNKWYFIEGGRYEQWEVLVSEKGIEITRYSEDHGGTWYYEHLTEVLIEAVAIYKGYRNDTRVQME